MKGEGGVMRALPDVAKATFETSDVPKVAFAPPPALPYWREVPSATFETHPDGDS
ncbi:hypothetical protein [Amycolatopsis alba]|uniref:hypothetical protein n=1 Tax=Amycolatopsis alba TaxID=76020 RepID=UPI0003A851DB|nr:hypothetical protein [Amycolatopsis alba]